MNLENMLTDRGWHKKPHIVLFHLYEMSRRGKFIELESKLVKYTEKRHVDRVGEGESGMNGESSIALYTLPCIK